MRQDSTENDSKAMTDRLRALLAADLPGLTAQKKMAPRLGTEFFRSFKPSADARCSAVLLLLIGKSLEDCSVVFTLRSTKIAHSGQISFPGGRCEAGETAEQTALRETYEEIGIPEHVPHVLGRLSVLYVPPSNSVITPVVAHLESLPELNINHDEVEEVFTLPLSELSMDNNIKTEIWPIGGIDMEVSFWDLHPTPLWGATAMMLSEFLELIK